MNIFNIFRSKKITESKITNPESSVYFHEDSFNQVELLPRENLFYLQKENEQIENFAEDNFVGNGFKDIYRRKENPMTVEDKKISFDKLDKMLIELGLEKISEVYEGYGSTKWKCENTFAYTLDRAEIFISSKDSYIKDFWINGFRFHKDIETKTKLKNVLLNLGNEMDLILNDWDLTITIDLKIESEIKKYLNEEF
ncbi:hypothetical protein [Flavobacterium sp. CAN_S2]|jgi:hypothetical protein|uniref:hypothetical protein n=1 Tax=Flavobacterium sp. CAN_S2 TaxID=2787726 RepID=UPI0018CBE26A